MSRAPLIPSIGAINMLGSKAVITGHMEVSYNTAENGGTINQTYQHTNNMQQVELSRGLGLESVLSRLPRAGGVGSRARRFSYGANAYLYIFATTSSKLPRLETLSSSGILAPLFKPFG